MAVMLAIAIKDLLRALRNVSALMTMFGIPLLVTGMFYLMFGSAAQKGDFDLPRVVTAVVNLDQDAPRLRVGRDGLPEGMQANTMSELVLAILESDDLSELIEVRRAPDAASAYRWVDERQAAVAVIVPEGFSRQFADQNGQATIEFYADPTLTIGPAIVRAMLSRFMDGFSGIKIAVDVALDQHDPPDERLVGGVLQALLTRSRSQTDDAVSEFLLVRTPGATATTPSEPGNPVLAIITPIMAGMMIFYAYYTGVSTAQSIVKEDEEGTLSRLFTTPAGREQVLAGKLLAVLLTVLVQVLTLLLAARLIFGMQWGAPLPVALSALGIVLSASAYGIFVNSLLRSTRQAGLIFGAVTALVGMVGLMRVFVGNVPGAEQFGESVSLFTPQGWAIRGLLGSLNSQPLEFGLWNLLALLAWSGVFLALGGWRFRQRFL